MKMRKFFISLTLLFSSLYSFADSQDDFFKACMQCDLEAAKKHVANGADPKAMHPSNQNSLALSYFCPNVTKWLLEQGVDPKSDGGGALIGACNNYSIEVVKLLLEGGADPNMVSPIYNANAIDITLRQTNCVPCLKMLAENGADLKFIHSEGTNYVHELAVFARTPEDRKTDFAKAKGTMEGYGLKVPDWYGNLGPDRNGESKDLLKILIDGGADINLQVNGKGYTPLMVGIGIVPGAPAKQWVAEALVEAGADVTIKTDLNVTAIALAASMDNGKLLKMIIEKGGDVNSEYWWLDSESGAMMKGFTPLILAAKYNNVDNCKVLFEKGARPGKGVHGIKVDKKDDCVVFVRDKTAIYFAIETGNQELVEVFTDNFKFWNNNQMILKKPERSEEQDYGNITIKTTNCSGSKAPIPPGVYAGQLGYKEIKKFLATKGL